MLASAVSLDSLWWLLHFKRPTIRSIRSVVGPFSYLKCPIWPFSLNSFSLFRSSSIFFILICHKQYFNLSFNWSTLFHSEKLLDIFWSQTCTWTLSRCSSNDINIINRAINQFKDTYNILKYIYPSIFSTLQFLDESSKYPKIYKKNCKNLFKLIIKTRFACVKILSPILDIHQKQCEINPCSLNSFATTLYLMFANCL